MSGLLWFLAGFAIGLAVLGIPVIMWLFSMVDGFGRAFGYEDSHLRGLKGLDVKPLSKPKPADVDSNFPPNIDG